MEGEIQTELSQSIEDVIEIGSQVGPHLIWVLILLLAGLFVAQWLGRALQKLLVRLGVPERRALFPVTIAHIAVLLIAAIVVLSLLGIPIVSLVRVVFGTALALLALFIILKPYLPSFPLSKGDTIAQGSTLGTVDKITFANTVVTTFDGKVVFIPNQQLLNAPLVNMSRQPHRRADISFCVSYDEDLDRVKGIVQGLLEEDERVLADPAPVVVVTDLTPSYREMMARFWASSQGFLATQWAVREAIDNALTGAGVRLGTPRIEIVSDGESATAPSL